MAEPVQLSSDERAKVEAARLVPRPQYFNADSLQQTQISEDFEAFLVLQDPDTIESTIKWLTKAGEIGKKRLDRNSVAFEALVLDTEDREAKQSEVADLTESFNEWRADFQAGKFSDTEEVGLLIRDAMATVEEIFVFEERMKHLEAIQFRVSDRIRSDLSNAQLQELLSWPTPLLVY
jgi:hypothetical protein